MLKKIIGGLLIFLSLGGFLSRDYILATLVLGLGVFFILKKKKKSSKEKVITSNIEEKENKIAIKEKSMTKNKEKKINKATIQVEAPKINEDVLVAPTKIDKPKKERYIFKVAGVTYEGRQGIIKKMVKDWKIENDDWIYEGLSNKEIKEEWDDVYEVDISDWCDIYLESEPDNEYDKNAIKVISEYGMLGYVPKESNLPVKDIMEKDYTLFWELVGGKYKYYDDEEDKVLVEELTYGIEITLEYLEEVK